MKLFSFLYKKLHINIPISLKKDFDNEILSKNYSKLFSMSIVFFTIELIVYLLPQRLFDYKTIFLHVLLINAVLIPIIYVIKNRFNKINKILALAVQDFYLLTLMFLFMYCALKSQGKGDFIHLYLMTVMSFASFFYFKYLHSVLLFGSVFAYFAVMLPFYQTNSDISFIIMSNAVLFNVLSLLIIYIRLQNKVSSFKDKKLLEKIASSDSMTNLYNHEASIKLLSKEIEKSNKNNCLLSFIMIDIDNFKEINDTYGHVHGDEIIKDVADIIVKNSLGKDIIGRYGGDEFVLILPNTDVNGAGKIITRIFKELSHKKMPVTLSAGISQYDKETLDEFVKKTDKKLYKAKQMGKNRFVSV